MTGPIQNVNASDYGADLKADAGFGVMYLLTELDWILSAAP